MANAVGDTILGGRFKDRESIRIAMENGTATEMELMKYRMQGHKFLVSGSTADTLYEAFGGFDLDDKVIGDLSFLRDTNGNRRLASFVWRQPTGPQEFALMFPHLDEDTLIRMLGSENQFAERFQLLAGAVSDSISEQRFNRIPSIKAGATALELNSLNEEEKIIKYVSLLSRNKSAAKQYIEGMDTNNPQFFEKVEKAIFRILDVGNRDASGSTMGLQFSQSSRNISIQNILKHLPGASDILEDDFRFINLPEINEEVVRLAATGRFGTARQLTPEIAEKLAAVDPKFGMQYRQSGFIRMFETKMSLDADVNDPVLRTVRDILESNKSVRTSLGRGFGKKTSDQIFETTRAGLKNAASVSENDVAYRIAGKILQSDSIDDEIKFQIEEAFNKSFNRQQYAAFAAEDGLGIYVNKLGFASSLDMQRQDAISSIMERLNTSNAFDANDLQKRLSSLRINSIPVYTPEQAIDAAIAGGGGRLKIAGSAQELYAATQIFSSDSQGVLDEFTRNQAINKSLSRLAVVKTGVDFGEEAVLNQFQTAFRELGHSEAQITQKIQALTAAYSNNKKGFSQQMQDLVTNLLDQSGSRLTAGDSIGAQKLEQIAFGFMDVGAASVGSAAVAGSAQDMRRVTCISNYVRCRKIKKNRV